jgi:hypothetical protein
MVCRNLDATILLEQPPDVTYEDGLFYITDTIGSLTIRRCMRRAAFLTSIANFVELARQHGRSGEVVPLHAAKP